MKYIFPLIIMIALIVLLANFDKLCIKGRISQAQAEIINVMPWQHVPSYCDPETAGNKLEADDEDIVSGDRDCRAKERDRILNRQCSVLFKKIF